MEFILLHCEKNKRWTIRFSIANMCGHVKQAIRININLFDNPSKCAKSNKANSLKGGQVWQS